MLRLAALLLLLASACACPDGMRDATSEDRKALKGVGLEAFINHAQELCDKMPVYITQPEAFDTSVTAVCTTANRRSAQFQVTFASPCKNGSTDTVLMTVNRSPDGCDKAYVPKNNKWGWYTTTPGNMRPLQCPKGFRKATSGADKKLLTAFLFKQLTQRAMPAMEKHHSKLFCEGGIQQMTFTYQNGCVQVWPKGVSPYVMAQGKVSYTCYGKSKTNKIGLDGEGLYRTTCEWAVAFDVPT